MTKRMDELSLLLVSLLVLAVLMGFLISKRLRRSESLRAEQTAAKTAAKIEPAKKPLVQVPVKKDLDLSQRLSSTRSNLLSKLGGVFGKGSAQNWSSTEWEAMEEALLEGDVGVGTTNLLLDKIKQTAKNADGKDVRALLREEAEKLLTAVPQEAGVKTTEKPLVISIVGVNGAGKTTTVGKLAEKYQKDGKKVLLGAVDTFRAAAISQLKVWADRTGAQFVTGREGADPGAVAFDSVAAAKARGMDVVLLDTAGRLHTKSNLMEELKKVHRVIKKVIPEAPHETWLVLDGTAGQNAVQQAREFQKTLELTGVIVTKLDGTAKGGAVFSIAAELRLPVKYIGVGETAADLVPFEPQAFVAAILA